MSERASKLIFWIGTLVSVALFLGLTWDTHGRFDALTNADRLDAQAIAGKRAFERYNCNDCHTVLGFGGYYAPDLTRVHARLGPDTIRRRIKSPEIAFADSFRKMPQQGVGDQEIEDMVAWFAWVSEIQNNDWPPQHSEERWQKATRRALASGLLSPAAALVQAEGCLGCHPLGDQGTRGGPRLEWIGERRDAEYVAAYLTAPPEGVGMPAFDHLPAEERRMIGEFIVSLAKEGRMR